MWCKIMPKGVSSNDLKNYNLAMCVTSSRASHSKQSKPKAEITCASSFTVCRDLCHDQKLEKGIKTFQQR